MYASHRGDFTLACIVSKEICEEGWVSIAWLKAAPARANQAQACLIIKRCQLRKEWKSQLGTMRDGWSGRTELTGVYSSHFEPECFEIQPGVFKELWLGL